MHQLIDVCLSNQPQISLLRQEVSQWRDELRAMRAAPAPSPQAASDRQTRIPTRVPSNLPNPMPPFVVTLQGVRSKSPPGVLCSLAVPIAPVQDARCTEAVLLRPCLFQSSSEPQSGGMPQRVHPECSTRHCTLHCSSSRCQFHHAPRLGGGNLLSDGPTIPHVHSKSPLSTPNVHGCEISQFMTDSTC